jgi:hypothetical protein
VGAKLARDLNNADMISESVHDSQVLVTWGQEKQPSLWVQYKTLMSTWLTYILS